jgi:hypothetical protein
VRADLAPVAACAVAAQVREAFAVVGMQVHAGRDHDFRAYEEWLHAGRHRRRSGWISRQSEGRARMPLQGESPDARRPRLAVRISFEHVQQSVIEEKDESGAV